VVPSKSRTSLLAIVLVAIVTIGGVGSYLAFHQQPGIQITTTTSAVTTIPSTQIITQPRLYRLYGKLFSDYNGNGKQEKNEPPVPDVTVALNGANLTTTNATGCYIISEVTEGLHRVRIFPPSRFRYMCESAAEFRTVQASYEVLVSNDTRKDIGLMEGFLTLPFLSSASVRGEPYYVDLDLGPEMRDWKGGKRVGHDNHYGIDYDMPEGESIVAPAPGVVIEAEGNWPNVSKDPNLGLWDDGNRVVVNHGRVGPYNRDFYTIYCHLKKVLCTVGQRVSRGEKIAESGNTGAKTGGPHLHFQCGGFGLRRVDPYRDLLNPSSVSYWTRDNDPQFPQ